MVTGVLDGVRYSLLTPHYSLLTPHYSLFTIPSPHSRRLPELALRMGVQDALGEIGDHPQRGLGRLALR
ncbi:hypothetical protein SAMN05444161_0402 [Rhizobiales bacterium GAS191]|nr:hypothetical protein SAMN05519103_07891 [Rhizobiales bacterium GAS113]SEC05078.1 hypothetical protein SAMN05444161_0402 [Rhizobiales bacterium GAS191]